MSLSCALEPLLEAPHPLHQRRQLRGHLHPSGPDQRAEPLAEVAQRAVQLAPRRGPVELPLPDEGPLNQPVPDDLEELPEPHFEARAARRGRAGRE